jgi:DNA-binding transcriptional LysR family regulator
VEVFETVLGGTAEAIAQRRVDLAITPSIPTGFIGEPLLRWRFVAVAHPSHALHTLGRALGVKDLRKHRHLVVRDSAARRGKSSPSVEVAQRWISNMSTSMEAAALGHCFAWYPEERIREHLREGKLTPPPLREGGERWAETYLVHVERDAAGPGTLRLAEILREQVKQGCIGHEASGSKG